MGAHERASRRGWQAVYVSQPSTTRVELAAAADTGSHGASLGQRRSSSSGYRSNRPGRHSDNSRGGDGSLSLACIRTAIRRHRRQARQGRRQVRPVRSRRERQIRPVRGRGERQVRPVRGPRRAPNSSGSKPMWTPNSIDSRRRSVAGFPRWRPRSTIWPRTIKASPGSYPSSGARCAADSKRRSQPRRQHHHDRRRGFGVENGRDCPVSMESGPRAFVPGGEIARGGRPRALNGCMRVLPTGPIDVRPTPGAHGTGPSLPVYFGRGHP